MFSFLLDGMINVCLIVTVDQGYPNFWHHRATLEEEELSWAAH